MLEIDNIDVYYGDIQVLFSVSLECKEGKTITLIGANGAGKTTLLRAISGLLHPRSGAIKLCDKCTIGMNPESIMRLGIAHIPEGRRLFTNLTVYENLELGATPIKDKAKIVDSVKWVYDMFPILRERKNQRAGTLSGGEQQMLAICRGLMSRPKLLMLDEPSMGLAPIIVRKLFDTIGKLKTQGISILLVEQNIFLAFEFADKGYVLNRGRIVLHGKPSDLLGDGQVKKAYLTA